MEHLTLSVYNFEPNLSFQIFQLLPVTKMSYIPYDVEDSVECLPVRPRRSILPYPRGDGTADAYTVFQVLSTQMSVQNKVY